MARGKVIYATPGAHLIALDAVTGKVVWQQAFANVRSGETSTVAPLVVKNLVLIGSSGGEFGVRGHLDAFDIDTGSHAWRALHDPEAR